MMAGRGRLLFSDSSEPNACGSFTNSKGVDVEEISKVLVKVVDCVLADAGVVSFWVVDVKVVEKEWSTLLVRVLVDLLVDIDVVSCLVVGFGVVGEELSTVDIVEESSGTADKDRNSSIFVAVNAV